MADYDRNNRGAIWKNDDKQNPGHPDFKGSLNVDGVDYWVSAWKRKEGANPKSPALSFSIKPKDAPDPRRTTPARDDRITTGRQQMPRDMDDEIPFAPEVR